MEFNEPANPQPAAYLHGDTFEGALRAALSLSPNCRLDSAARSTRIFLA
jgi:hypothetical protein